MYLGVLGGLSGQFNFLVFHDKESEIRHYAFSETLRGKRAPFGVACNESHVNL